MSEIEHKCSNCNEKLIIKPTTDKKWVCWCELCNLIGIGKTKEKAIEKFYCLMKLRIKGKKFGVAVEKT